MPFYRSVLQDTGGGGGGGGGSTENSYIKFVGPDNVFDSYPPLMFMSNSIFRLYSSNYNNMVNNINEIAIGNRVVDLGSMWFSSYGPQFNGIMNLQNATSLQFAGSVLNGCKNFNSQIIFPETSSMYIDSFPGEVQNNYQVSYFGFLNGCSNYNLVTTLKMHEISTNENTVAFVAFPNFFSGCSNFNSRVLFDLDKLHKDESGLAFSKVLCNCDMMFANCNNFNQPIVFPSGLYSASYTFSNCNNFNQPVVFDCGAGSYKEEGIGSNGFMNYRLDGVFYRTTNMRSDIIFKNFVVDENTNYYFWNFIRVNNYLNTNSLNIYVDNIEYFTNQPNMFAMDAYTQQPTWDTTSNGVFNSQYNVYILNNIGDALNNFNNYYFDLYGEYPIYN